MYVHKYAQKSLVIQEKFKKRKLLYNIFNSRKKEGSSHRKLFFKKSKLVNLFSNMPHFSFTFLSYQLKGKHIN